MQENPRINQQDRQKIMFLGSANPKEISQQCTPATHREKLCTARGSSWGFPSLSLTTKGSWIYLLGRVAKPLVSSLMPVPPGDAKTCRSRITRRPGHSTLYICCFYRQWGRFSWGFCISDEEITISNVTLRHGLTFQLQRRVKHCRNYRWTPHYVLTAIFQVHLG